MAHGSEDIEFALKKVDLAKRFILTTIAMLFIAVLFTFGFLLAHARVNADTGAKLLFAATAAQMAFVAVCAVLVVSVRLASLLWSVGLGLLLGGVGGNLTDRIIREPSAMRGHVIDWLMLPNWPVFNIADMCIIGAAIVIIIQSLRGVTLRGERVSEDQSDT